MRVVFLIPGDQTISGQPEQATHRGRLLVATSPEELGMVPESWVVLDVDWAGSETVTVTEWMREAGA